MNTPREVAKSLYEMGYGKTLTSQQEQQITRELIDMVNAFSAAYPEMLLYVTLAGAGRAEIYVHGIRLPDELQGRGIGSQVMAAVNGIADKHGLSVSLDPSPDAGKKAALAKFYQRLGFGSKSKRKFYDPTAKGSWIRPEQKP